MASKTTTAEDKVRAAYRQLAMEAGQFVKVLDLRYRLAAKGLSFTAQDEVLTAMFTAREVNLVPQANQQALTADQRATPVRVGGEDKHLISIR